LSGVGGNSGETGIAAHMLRAAWMCSLLSVLGTLALAESAAPVSAPDATAAISSDTTLRVFAVGDIADCRRESPERSVARLTAELVPPGAIVLALGDMAYRYSDSATLASCYEPTWGKHLAATLASAGNHDYVNGTATDFRRYFGLETAAPRDFVAYARWLNPSWYLIALDSNVRGATLDQQYDWLQQTLQREFGSAQPGTAGDATRCIAVMWHAPLFSSGWHRGSGEHMRRFWELLDSYEADLVLSGHEHFYEAFEPRTSDGTMRRGGEGLRQFVVGTGGTRLYGFWKPPYASRARIVRHGVLGLTLQPATYAWDFIGTDGLTHDRGAAPCRHRVRVPVQAAN
jgi:3',5'-cyclic AMP phosphodiesterase CpdA